MGENDNWVICWLPLKLVVESWFNFNLPELIIFNQFELKRECASYSWLGVDPDVATVFINDVFSDHQSKTYSASVLIFSVLNKSKQLKQLLLIFLADSNTRILHRYV